MKITELLPEIYRLLLEDRRSCATDLLVEFMFMNQEAFAGLHFGQLGELSQGSPEEIVSHLRKNLTEHRLYNLDQQPVINFEDPHDLNDDDLEMIDAVATEWQARSESYIYDEEDTLDYDKLPTTLTMPEKCHPLPHNEASSHIDKINLSEEDDEDIDEDFDEDLNQFSYEPTEDDKDVNWISREDDEDDDNFSDNRCLSEEIEPLDDLFLQADSSQSVGNLVDDSDDDLFDFDEDDDAHTDEEFGGRSVFEEVDTSGGLTTEERARQLAVRVAMSYGWGHIGVDLLSEIFEEHGWGQARIAIEYLTSVRTSVTRMCQDIGYP